VDIRLPLTLAIIEASAWRGQRNLRHPCEQVVECVELPAEENNALALKASSNSAISHFPSFTLGTISNCPEIGPTAEHCLVQHGQSRWIGSRRPLRNYANGHQALPAVFKAIPGVSGSAIVGNGRVALIWMSACSAIFQRKKCS